MRDQYQKTSTRVPSRDFFGVGVRLTRSVCSFLLLLLVGGSGVAAAAPLLHQLLDLQAQPDAAREVEEYWTPERRAAARPMPLLESLPAEMPLVSPPSPLGPDAPPPTVMPGWPPGQEAAGSRSLIELTPNGIEAGEMRGQVEFLQAPGGDGPQFPEDFAHYAPFQRWTWSESYLNYPTSTIGMLFFLMDANGDGLLELSRCTGAVIRNHTVATAAHCLHNSLGGVGAYNGQAVNVEFCPSYGEDGIGSTPRGCWKAVAVAFPPQWVSGGGNSDRDYGCIVTEPQGGVNGRPLGSETGVLGVAYNQPSRQSTFAWGYPIGFPFSELGEHLIAVVSTEWYENLYDLGDSHQKSKYIGGDMGVGSSGGPWWINMSHPNPELEFPDVDESPLTNPGQGIYFQPLLNGVTSHRRPGFLLEMGSPVFRNTAEDPDESADVFQRCFDREESL